MSIGRDVDRDLGEVQVHGRGVDVRENQGGGLLGRRADGGEDIGGGVALVARLPRPAAAARPLPRQLALLADPGLVLEPDLELLPDAFSPTVAAISSGSFFS